MSTNDDPWLAWAQTQDTESTTGSGGHLNTSNEARNIWVFAELDGGFVTPEVKQVLGKAREIGDWLGARVQAVLFGASEAIARDLISYGADTVLKVEHPLLAAVQLESQAKALTQLVERYRPEMLLLAATRLTEDLAPWVAARVGSGYLADAIDLELDDAERLLRVTRATFGGKIQTVSVTDRKPQIATVRPGAFREADYDRQRRGEIVPLEIELSDADRPTRVVEVLPGQGPNLENARVIVAGGKGVGDKESWKLIEQLAEALGAQLGATKSAVAAGWADPSMQIGLTGKKVKPDLYVAVGVSGSLDHQDGMAQARTIVAVNTDREAPIMALADFALLGELKEVLPAWTKALLERQGKRPVGSAS